MHSQKFQFYFLIICIVSIGIISFFILKPFIYVLLFSGMLAILFQPVYKKVLSYVKEKTVLASAITMLIIVLCILIPLSFLSTQLITETTQLYHSLSDETKDKGILMLFREKFSLFQDSLPFLADKSLDLSQYIKQATNWLIQNLGFIFSNIASMLTSLFIFMFSLFYFLKDGYKIRSFFLKISPLSEQDNEDIISKLILSVNSVVKGNILVALIQGVAVTLGLSIFGVPNPFLWGSFAVIAALIPAIGTALIMIPAIIFLFLTGHAPQAFGLSAWAVLGVGLIDNFLSPKIVGKNIKMHPLITFLAILGGLAYFGIIGFILGPIVISIFFALIDIFFTLSRKTSI